MRRLYKKVFFICIFNVILSIIIFENGIFKNSESPKKSLIIENISNTICQPVSDQSEFQIVIDGRQYPQRIPNYMNKSINFDCLNSKSIKKKIILAWNKFHSYLYDYEGENRFKRNGCPVTNCELTHNNTRVYEADYVVVHMRTAFDTNIPKKRPSFQQWIFLQYESPLHKEGNYSAFKGVFNLTSTYKTQSDFFDFYSRKYYMRWVEKINKKLNFYDENKKFASALISNSGDKAKRVEYIEEMKKHVNVEIFGKHGTPCPKSGDCRDHVLDNFKFFLAFENSFCEEYISEKFFLTLHKNIIPVVRGGGNYAYYVSNLF